jgi:Xaa-Pro aminopeptidase
VPAHPQPIADLASLPAMDVARRATGLQDRLRGAEVDALLVSDLTNIRYLTGFTGSAALLLVAEGGLTFVTDGRYGQQAEAQLASAGVAARIEVSGAGQKDLVVGAVVPPPGAGAHHRDGGRPPPPQGRR